MESKAVPRTPGQRRSLTTIAEAGDSSEDTPDISIAIRVATSTPNSEQAATAHTK
jgi:hypothetical protein